MIKRNNAKPILPLNDVITSLGLPQSGFGQEMQQQTFDGTLHQHLRKRPFALLFCCLVVIQLLGLVVENKFALIRTLAVDFHYHVAPVLFPKGDLSEGGLFTRLGLSVPEKFVGEGNGGCVWDVGANNGVWNSNSYYLINKLGFKGFLYEVDAGTFVKLRGLYGGAGRSDRVKLYNYGLGGKETTSVFKVFPMGFENTVIENKNSQFDSQVFEYQVAIRDAKEVCKAMKVEGCEYGVLSIDVEGLDALVLKNAHLPDCVFDVVILETPNEEQMSKLGYKLLLKDHYNSIFVPDGRKT